MRALTATRKIEGYVWVDDVIAYDAAAGLVNDQGLIPVIKPADSARRRRWAKVLRWYGLMCGGHYTPLMGSPVTSFEVATAMPSILLLDPELAPFARLLSLVTGRTWDHIVARLARIDRYCRSDGSLLLIGQPRQFQTPQLRTFNQHLQEPWGLLTAADAPTFSFAIAKSMAASNRRRRDVVTIDVPAGDIGQIRGACDQLIHERVTPRSLRPVLTAGEWAALAVRAHGEAAHLNLESVVLCGLPGNRETVKGIEVAGGCGTSADGARRCKRARGRNGVVMGFQEIRSQHVALFSCTSFSIVDSFFGSDLSGVLALADGYACSALGTDRVLGIDASVPPMFLRLLRSGYSLGVAVALLNDVSRRSSDGSPYVLFGDPAATAVECTPHDRKGVSVEEMLVCPLRDWSAVVTDIDDRRLSHSPAIGKKFAIFALRGARRYAASDDDLPPRLVDRSSDWNAARRLLRDYGKRLARADWIERATRRLFRKEIQVSPAFVTQLDQLRLIREAAAQSLVSALASCESVRQRGAWDKRLGEWTKVMSLHIGGWDKCWSRMMREHLFDGDCEFLLHDGFVRKRQAAGPHCPACGSATTTSTWIDPLGVQRSQQRVDCLSCGVREVWQPTGIRVSVPPLSPLRARTRRTVTINLRNSSRPFGPQTLNYWLIAELVDKGTDRSVFRQSWAAATPSTSLDIEIPIDLSPELHTLRIVAVQGLLTAYLRHRWRSVPAGLPQGGNVHERIEED
jgi:Zn ribbon nucleic-acid-binding protein